jgi:hypothetical protein
MGSAEGLFVSDAMTVRSDGWQLAVGGWRLMVGS